MDLISPVCPSRVRLHSPVWASHKQIVLSELPLANVLPSGEYAMELTESVCPVSRLISAPVCAS